MKMDAVLFCGVVIVLFFSRESTALSRNDFPPGFAFGVGSSAFQYEGAMAEDGRKPSIIDTFTHKPGTVLNGSNADVAVDQYHRYKEDVDLIHQTGMDVYRFSISWSRLLPDGRRPINPKGLEYYNKLINELISHGIEPYITLYHFDLPQSLDDEYGGWLSPKIIDDFTGFANVCFAEFGDRVKNWMTFNEPNFFALFGYSSDIFPPQRCTSSEFVGNCSGGNSTTEPYIVGHNVLLAHAAAVDLYRKTYQPEQGGSIGLTIVSLWFVPLTDEPKDLIATQRTRDFQIGWFLDPIIYGDYPSSMRNRVGSRLPSFTKQQSQKLKGSFDLIGLNHYSTYYAYDPPAPVSKDNISMAGYGIDQNSYLTVIRDGVPISNKTAFYGMPIVPWGIQGLLEYMKTHYNNPPVSILENGYAHPKNSSLSLEEKLVDDERINYHKEYLKYIHAAVINGSDCRGYIMWTLLDDFEIGTGYAWETGLFYVDFDDNLKRYPRTSASWFREFLRRDTVEHLESVGNSKSKDT
uniref:Beta-glucosidase n=1 Tax=Araucaria cunninghamii TaxID=56994 RepID=A0A0D6QZZ2_ARACU